MTQDGSPMCSPRPRRCRAGAAAGRRERPSRGVRRGQPGDDVVRVAVRRLGRCVRGLHQPGRGTELRRLGRAAGARRDRRHPEPEAALEHAEVRPFEMSGDFNSDLAFEDGYAYQGNYDGVQVWDVDRPREPELVGALHCPGSQNDVTVNDGIIVTSTDSRRNKAECDRNDPRPTRPGRDQLGGHPDLRRLRSRGAGVRHRRAHRLRLAHPHGHPGAQAPADLRVVLRHRRRALRLRGPARPDLDRRDPAARTPGTPGSSTSRSCSRTAARPIRTPSLRATRRAAMTSPSTRSSTSRPARAWRRAS